MHGAGDDHRVWRAQLDGLSDEFTVVAWDEPSSPTLAGYADRLAELIRSIDLGPAHVAGLSWGGTVVLELYRRHPDVVRTLVLADTYAGWRGSLTEEELRTRVASVRDDPQYATLSTQLAIMSEADLRDVLPGITVPTLLLWGETDPRSPLRIAHEFRRAIPHAELVVIPGAGHLSNVDRPDEFNAAVREFCRAH